MNAFEQFLWENHLKQVDVLRYLGISSSAVSNVIKGKAKFSKANIVKLINNPYGWNTSMLESLIDDEGIGSLIPRQQVYKPEEKQPVLQESADSWYKMMFVELSKRVAEQDELIAKLQARIKELENQ